MKTYFKQLFNYDKWANQLLMEKFERQFPVNPRIYQLFSHILSAQQLWLDRAMALPQSVGVWAERIPEEMKEDIKNYNAAWLDFIDGLDTPDFGKLIHYTNSQGKTYDTRLADIITHVISHGTHHRGGMLILMKEEGFVPPLLDFVAFVRE